MFKSLLPYLLLGIAIAACSPPEYVSEFELVDFVNKSPSLTQAKTVSNITVKVSYRPTDLMVVQELGSHPDINGDLIRSTRKKFADKLYFTLRLSANHKEVLQAGNRNHSALLETLAFRMHDYISLHHQNRDIPLADAFLHRTFGFAPSTDVLLVFEKRQYDLRYPVELIVKEFGLGIGRLAFSFDPNDFETAPKISFQQ